MKTNMKIKDIEKIKIKKNYIEFIDKYGNVLKMKKRIEVGQFIDYLVFNGIIKLDKIE